MGNSSWREVACSHQKGLFTLKASDVQCKKISVGFLSAFSFERGRERKTPSASDFKRKKTAWLTIFRSKTTSVRQQWCHLLRNISAPLPFPLNLSSHLFRHTHSETSFSSLRLISSQQHNWNVLSIPTLPNPRVSLKPLIPASCWNKWRSGRRLAQKYVIANAIKSFGCVFEWLDGIDRVVVHSNPDNTWGHALKKDKFVSQYFKRLLQPEPTHAWSSLITEARRDSAISTQSKGKVGSLLK